MLINMLNPHDLPLVFYLFITIFKKRQTKDVLRGIQAQDGNDFVKAELHGKNEM